MSRSAMQSAEPDWEKKCNASRATSIKIRSNERQMETCIKKKKNVETKFRFFMLNDAILKRGTCSLLFACLMRCSVFFIISTNCTEKFVFQFSFTFLLCLLQEYVMMIFNHTSISPCCSVASK